MKTHEWKAAGMLLTAEHGDFGPVVVYDDGRRQRLVTPGKVRAAICAEILRLAEENRALKEIVAARDGTLAMAVARLGGEVEGAPTHRGNFLQRIDQLVEDDDRWRKACLNYEGIKRQNEARITALEAEVAELEAERDRAWDRAIRERDRRDQTRLAVAFSSTESELRGQIRALEAEVERLKGDLNDALGLLKDLDAQLDGERFSAYRK